MNVQAIWENGVFRPVFPISIKHTKLTIVVPDEEIATNESEPLPTYDLNDFPIEVREDVARLQAISDAVLTMSFPDELSEEGSEEQEQRTRAFELRNATRREQGRPV
jgi:predicted DNA-binding antitoxin AbrB/MazE fold protein